MSACSAGTAAHTPATTQTPVPTVQVPNVTMMTKRDAYAALQSLGLDPVIENFNPGDLQIDSRIVTEQRPAPWGTVSLGTRVELRLDEPTPTPTPAPTPTAAPPATDIVTYKVTGNGVGSATISYSVPDGSFSQQQAVGVGLPWSQDFTRSGSFNVYTIVAQGGGGDGSLTCEIDVNGHPLTTQTSTGAYAVVTCSH